MLRVLGKHDCSTMLSRWHKSTGAAADHYFRRLILGGLASAGELRSPPAAARAKRLHGERAPPVDLSSVISLPFSRIADLVALDVPVLYRPTSDTFRCDGILMPAASDRKTPIRCLECST